MLDEIQRQREYGQRWVTLEQQLLLAQARAEQRKFAEQAAQKQADAMQIAFDLQKNGLDLRVVSMPSVELFLGMGKAYENLILPSGVKTAVIEAGKSTVWHRFATNENYILRRRITRQ